MAKKLFSTVLFLTLMAVSFAACEKKEPVSSQTSILPEGPIVSSTETSVSVSASTETSVSVSTETSISEDVSEADVSQGDAIETIQFEVYIINQCKADIGMVSVIDPNEENQVNVGALADNEVLTLKYSAWPKDVTTFDVAFYNNNGDMVSSTSVDITGVKEKVTISLTGEGNIDDLKGKVE